MARERLWNGHKQGLRTVKEGSVGSEKQGPDREEDTVGTVRERGWDITTQALESGIPWEADGSNPGVNHWQLELRTERLRALLLGFKMQQGNGSLALPQAQVIKYSQDGEISGA